MAGSSPLELFWERAVASCFAWSHFGTDQKKLCLRFYPSLFCFCWAWSLFPEGLLTDGCDSEATEVQNGFASVKTARLRDTERDPRPKAECKACGKSVTSDRETWSGGGVLWSCTWKGLLGSTRGNALRNLRILFCFS